jgi:hypothetical protein
VGLDSICFRFLDAVKKDQRNEFCSYSAPGQIGSLSSTAPRYATTAHISIFLLWGSFQTSSSSSMFRRLIHANTHTKITTKKQTPSLQYTHTHTSTRLAQLCSCERAPGHYFFFPAALPISEKKYPKTIDSHVYIRGVVYIVISSLPSPILC